MGDHPETGARPRGRLTGVSRRPARVRRYLSPGARGTATITLLGASSAGFILLALQWLVGPPLTIPARTPAAQGAVLLLGLGSLLAYGGLVGGAIAVPMWTHRCYRNLPVLGRFGHLSPAWAACGWFIPVANVVLPWIALQDLWAGPGGSARGRWRVNVWLAAWLAAGAAGIAGITMPDRWHGFNVPVGEALLASAGVLLAVIVTVITQGQDESASSFPRAPTRPLQGKGVDASEPPAP
jgi:Domain of unknown function (DUF4328)